MQAKLLSVQALMSMGHVNCEQRCLTDRPHWSGMRRIPASSSPEEHHSVEGNIKTIEVWERGISPGNLVPPFKALVGQGKSVHTGSQCALIHTLAISALASPCRQAGKLLHHRGTFEKVTHATNCPLATNYPTIEVAVFPQALMSMGHVNCEQRCLTDRPHWSGMRRIPASSSPEEHHSVEGNIKTIEVWERGISPGNLVPPFKSSSRERHRSMGENKTHQQGTGSSFKAWPNTPCSQRNQSFSGMKYNGTWKEMSSNTDNGWNEREVLRREVQILK
ncbi:serine/threonine-protein phosphatase 2A regulatory subunit B'' subunit gamma [Platysternon megacephalum]|uniref:Serine/threonine-protein phosphatase 2A regulatory subunit B'' subunit gamma n=1 Tax=Platysternon megacephalum TaxID=55544 RepID=A0A4D9ERI2_9SAUR|nr:serine/threonine-protein phosphatase 2A regulatory subunit B'' subunit gamma [Platysternon megacephalum]